MGANCESVTPKTYSEELECLDDCKAFSWCFVVLALVVVKRSGPDFDRFQFIVSLLSIQKTAILNVTGINVESHAPVCVG